MSNTITSPNMNLPIPTVGVDLGPDWALNLNACLGFVDSHDHSSGKGVLVTPAGLNINADLSIHEHNLTVVRSLRFAVESAPLALITDLNCLYDVSGDLYFNDGSGDQIRMTQGGGIAGTPGSITGMTPPAYVHYTVGTETFTFGANSTTPANIDVGFINLRNNVSGSHKYQLLPPPAMAADLVATLPVPPSQPSVVAMNSAGEMSAQLVTQSLLAPRSAGSVVSAGGVAISNSSASFSTSSTSAVAVTNLSVTLDTLGRPVQVLLQPVLTSGSVDANTVLLLHCDGSNGSTSFTDSGVHTHTVTANGTAQVSTSQVKFGTGALATDFSAAYLNVTGTLGDFAFGTGDFTIDFWVNSTSSPGGTEGMMGNTVNNNVGAAWEMRWNGGSGNIEFQADDGSASLGFGFGIINGNFGSWSHIAIVRSSGSLYGYVNGILSNSVVFGSNFTENNALRVGDNVKNPGSINGFYDEVRISNIARWTTNFTPPIAPYGSASAPGYVGATATGANAQATFTLYRDGVALVPIFLEQSVTGGSNLVIAAPPGSINYLDPVITGTHTYALYAQANGSGAPTAQVTDCQLIAYEI